MQELGLLYWKFSEYFIQNFLNIINFRVINKKPEYLFFHLILLITIAIFYVLINL